MDNKKKKAENLQFLLIGFLLIINGSMSSSYQIISYGVLFLGVLFLIYALYCIAKKKNGETLKYAALFCESMALYAAAFLLYKSGSKNLPYLYLFAATFLLVAIYLKFRKNEKLKNL